MPTDQHGRRPHKSGPGGSSFGEVVETNTLWVGSLAPETGDADVMAVFSRHGALDCATTRAGPRSYAFVMFHGPAQARAALEALKGTRIHGSAIKLEFARPAKAVRNLWIGGISPSLTKEQLEEEFAKFGKIEYFAFFRDRNSAHVDFYKLEDAISAHKSMNGKSLDGEQLCVDFQRSQAPRAEWLDSAARGSTFSTRGMVYDAIRPFHNSSQHGTRKTHGERRQEGQLSTVLWVGFPQSVQFTEDELYRAMIIYGEIERIKCFPLRHYAFVEFRSIAEASVAKERLEGRLFGDPRIQILFSKSEIAAQKDSGSYAGLTGMTDNFHEEGPFDRHDVFGPDERIGVSRSYRPHLIDVIPPGPNMLAMPQGLVQQRGDLGYHDFGGIPPTWRQRSPSATGILRSTERSPPLRALHGARDELDIREAKRMKMDGYLSEMGPIDVGKEGSDDFGDPPGFSHPDRKQDYLSRSFWCGPILKGGVYVCRAVGMPIGPAIERPLPYMLDCSAKASFDSLAEQHAKSVSYDVAYFLPENEEHFAPYTEFLQYLIRNERAGVVHLDKNTQFFLVPPLGFLRDVLHVEGPPRLYGVLFHFPTPPERRPQLLGPPMPPYDDEQEILSASLDKNHDISQGDNHAFRTDYNRLLHEGQVYEAGGARLSNSRNVEAQAIQSVHLGFDGIPTAASKAQVSLTPELLATLATLVPGNTQSTTSGAVPMHPAAMDRPMSTVMQDTSIQVQGWTQGNQATAFIEQPLNVPRQLLQQQLSNQAPVLPHLPASGNTWSSQEHSEQTIAKPSPASGSPNTVVLPTHGGQFLASQTDQHYQFNSSYASQSNYGTLQATTAASSFDLPVQQQVNPTPLPASDQVNLLQSQNAMALLTDKVSSSQVQQQQVVPSASVQGTSECDADKNKRYQMTLQFAATLLQQLKQRQLQGSAQSTEGSGNQQ